MRTASMFISKALVASLNPKQKQSQIGKIPIDIKTKLEQEKRILIKIYQNTQFLLVSKREALFSDQMKAMQHQMTQITTKLQQLDANFNNMSLVHQGYHSPIEYPIMQQHARPMLNQQPFQSAMYPHQHALPQTFQYQMASPLNTRGSRQISH